MNSKGLLERILAAPLPADVVRLLEEGKGYAKASPKTQRRWLRAIKRRPDSVEC